MTRIGKSRLAEIHVALICPFSTGPGRGNITTVQRIAHHLPSAGCRVTSISLDMVGVEAPNAVLERARPDLLHAFHAYYAGSTARTVSRILDIPYLITITGSDLFDSSICNAPETRQTIIEADAVSCFDLLVAERLTKVFPEISSRLSVIPQGVDPLPLQHPIPIPGDNFMILLPAALRPVKGVTNAIAALTPLAQEFPSLRLLVAGGTIDPDYADQVHRLAAELPWVHLAGNVSHLHMGAYYTAADLVLNSSVFEGGMPNSLLEAMVMGKPVLANDVLGNHSLIRHGETGWLYSNDNQLRERVRQLLLHPDNGTAVAEAGRAFVRKHCSPLTEANNYAALYRRLIR